MAFTLLKPSEDIFTSGCTALVNTTNTHNGGTRYQHGYMGAGLAKEFAQMFPGLDIDYYNVCKNGFEPGNIHIWENITLENCLTPKYVINFPTKREINRPSRLEYIQSGLVALTKTIQEYQIDSIAIPALGCGLGGLNFKTVQPIIHAWADSLVVKCEVYLFPP